MKVLVLLNGEYGDYQFCDSVQNYDKVICADNGMRHARILNICPDLIVGDFDSSDLEDLQYYRSQGVKIETFDTHKDATDSEIAIDRSVAAGADKVIVWGGVGTRMDHSLANIQLLYKLLKLGIQGELVNPYNRIRLVSDHGVLEGKKGQTVSLIPFMGNVKGITTKDLEYPLDHAMLTCDNSLGVSNVMINDTAELWLEEGTVIVIMAND